MATTDIPAAIRTGPGPVTTIIIGAGQAGLATAYHLQRAGLRAVVLDQHAHVGDQWRSRYESLRLNSPAQYDGLPGMAFPAPRWSYPTGADMGDFLAAYAENLDIDVRGGVRVREVVRVADGSYLVSTENDTMRARNVVIATGGERVPRVPEFAGELDPGIRQLHSSAYRRPADLLPGPVLVVGVGQSGADLALEVTAAGHETWLSGVVKTEIPVPFDSFRMHRVLPLLWFAANHVLTTSTPIGRRMQPVIRAGGTPLLRVKRSDLDAAGVHRVEQRTVGTSGGRPVLADGRILDVTNVLWCTGFDQDFGFITPPVTGDDGWPLDDGGIVTDAPGMYFVGLLFQRGFYSMLIGGAGRDAARIARHIAAREQALAAA
jgi:putative flavoprotein involved in K+ transport